jgi:intracellular sulfur oxidation DsrE/DsrF family protein
MRIVLSLALALLVGGLAFAPASHAQAGKAERHKLVLQVSDGDPAKWNLALNNAENVQQALGKDKVTVEIVAYGPGLNMLMAESKVAARLNGAMDNNVALLACATTMKKAKVTEADLAGGVKVVPAGVIHIMQRQREGWAYVRP